MDGSGWTGEWFFKVDDIKSAILERLWYVLAGNGIDITSLNLNMRSSELLRGYKAKNPAEAGFLINN